jgi:hypothetical protein
MTNGRVRRAIAVFAGAFGALACVGAAAGLVSYHIVNRIPIAGNTGWD